METTATATESGVATASALRLIQGDAPPQGGEARELKGAGFDSRESSRRGTVRVRAGEWACGVSAGMVRGS